MNKMKKFALIAVCAALLVCVTIGATVAWLTSTDKVENTFTVGKVKITLDEADVNEEGLALNTAGEPLGTDGNLTPAERVRENDYHLLPGCVYVKDPTVHVEAGSEACWVFVKVENGLAGIEGDPLIAKQITDNDWTALGEGYDGIYYRLVEKQTTVQDFTVFDNFRVKDAATNTELSNYAGARVKVTAYAIQFANFDSPAEQVWEDSGFATPTTGA